MANRRGLKRQKLFEVFAENLGFYHKSDDKLFVCPLCLRGFTENLRELLTLAHIWPKALGGRFETLACRECNSTIGNKLENHATAAYKELKAFDGSGESAVPMVVEELDFNLHLTIFRNQDGSPHYQIVSPPTKCVPPGAEERLRELFEVERTFTWRYRRSFDSDRVNLTYLHATHLMLFDFFGYEYLILPVAQQIIRQLQQLGEKLLQIRRDSVTVGTLEPYKLYLISAPIEKMGFVVTFPDVQNSERVAIIWMPPLAHTYTHEVEQDTLPPVTMTGTPIPFSYRHYFLGKKDGGIQFMVQHLRSRGLNAELRKK